MKLFLILAIFFYGLFSYAAPEIRGLRVDPSYFYGLYEGQNEDYIADQVITKAVAANVNTLFLYAYNPSNGAFYQTDYPMTEVEIGYGRTQVFQKIYQLALQHQMKVIAVFPITDFNSVWEQKPEWRSKLRDGSDYRPFPHSYYLSAWHPEYRKWIRGFVRDMLTRFPDLYAIEAVEPTVDCFWMMESDYNPHSNQEFFKRHPDGTLGDGNWKKFRAQGITDLLAIMSEEAHAKGVLSGVVQTWPANADGTLFSKDLVRDEIGFDIEGILGLQGNQKMDLIIGELMWQQWKAEHGTAVFVPEWTLRASQDFIRLVAGRSFPILHIEISGWIGQNSTVYPTIDEFHRSLQIIRDIAPGIDIYDHSQIENQNAWQALTGWN
jgi:hypothetical protein